jgi:hypothetical protein
LIPGRLLYATMPAIARNKPCQQSGRAIKYIQIQSRLGDRDAGGSGAAGPWEQQRSSFWNDIIYHNISHTVIQYITP